MPITLKKIKIENDHSQNIIPQQPNLQGSPMPMGYEQLKHPQNIKQHENTGNNDQLVKCKSFNEISIIR
jgi:hypothetical protein